MADPDTLRPEVREALDKLRACVLRCDPRLDPRVATIRAELLRQSREIANLRESIVLLDAMRMDAEAELVAQRARTEGAPSEVCRRPARLGPIVKATDDLVGRLRIVRVDGDD